MLRRILCSLLLAAPVAAQKVFHTVDAALQLAFGDATVERRTEALSDAQRERLDELSEVGGSRAIAFAYVARRDGKVVGTAYFDTHRVRTLRETVMVVVRPDGAVQRVVLCAFAEPVEYVPRASWYAQFAGRPLDDELRLRRGIDGMTGATLTSRATTDCVRRVLALHRVLAEAREREEPPPEPAPRPDPKPLPPAPRGEGKEGR